MKRTTMRNTRENLAWAFGYNLVLVPAAAVALSSVSVVGNALRLRRFRA
jgi:Cu+-exporting ATPase